VTGLSTRLHAPKPVNVLYSMHTPQFVIGGLARNISDSAAAHSVRLFKFNVLGLVELGIFIHCEQAECY